MAGQSLGLDIIGFAGYQGFQALRAKFRENATWARMGAAQRGWYITLGRIGYAARGAVFASVGLFLIGTARTGNP